jgi:hypothetical protein
MQATEGGVKPGRVTRVANAVSAAAAAATAAAGRLYAVLQMAVQYIWLQLLLLMMCSHITKPHPPSLWAVFCACLLHHLLQKTQCAAASKW